SAGPQHRRFGQRRLTGTRRGRPRRGRRRRQGGDRRARARSRRRVGTRAARGGCGRCEKGTGAVRLGVGAALVDGALVPGDVAGACVGVAAVGLERNGGRGIAAPGFVDLQVNGFAGVDFLGADADGYATAGDALLETGVTAYLPTFIASTEADLVSALRAVPDRLRGPRILGVHLEGPFLSPARLG